MKKAEIKPVMGALSIIRMPKIEDKDFRNMLIGIHVALFKASRKCDLEIEALRSAILNPYEKEIIEFEGLRSKIQIEKDSDKKIALIKEMESHTDLIQAIGEFNKAVNEILSDDIDIPKIDLEKFVEEYQKQDYDCSVVESLSPIFDV